MKFRKSLILLILIGIGSVVFMAFLSISKAIIPYLETLGSQEVQNAASRVMKNAVNTIQIDSKELVEITRDDRGKITHIEYNTQKLNEILSECIETAESSLLAVCEGERDPITYRTYYSSKFIAQIPLGILSRNVFLQDKGPKINISMKTLNSVKGKLNFITKEYGLNSTLVEIDVELNVSMAVIAPFHSNATEVVITVPIVLELVQGEIPNYTTTKIS